MNKLVDWKNRLKDRHMLSVILALFAIIIAMGIWIYKKQVDYRQASENQYNMAFYELVNYVQDVNIFSKIINIKYIRAWSRNINKCVERSEFSTSIFVKIAN